MAKEPKDYWVKTTREMLASVREVGAMPFILYQYYLTYEKAKDGVYPSLETIAKDLRLFDKKGKPSKSAVCNLKKTLLTAGWIKEENGKIIFPNHSEILNDVADDSENLNEHSEIMNEDSENLNGDSEILNTPYIRIEKEDLEGRIRKEDEEEATPAGATEVEILPNNEDEPEQIYDPNPLIATFQQYFDYELNKAQKKIIRKRIRDGTIWLEAVQYWAGRDHRASNIPGICDKYDELILENELIPKHSKGHSAGNGSKSNTEISQSRDYSDFDGFDHIAAFAEN